jgi:hypothetical protein
VWAAACGHAAAPSSSPSPTAHVVTYNDDIAPILYEHCAACHRPVDDERVALASDGDPICVAGAPFSVLSYESVRPRAKAIAAAVVRHAMPPWLPVPGHGEFAHERRLRDDDIARIQAWAAGGAPEGEPSRRPTPPAWPAGGWQLGKPDLVVTAGEPYALQPGTRDVFRNFVLPVPDGPRRYVRAVEFRVDDPRVLHHANVGVDAHRSSRRLDRADPLPGFATMPDDDVRNVFGWSPGKVPILEPADAAWVLDEGSDLVVQLHMVASKRAASVRPVLGLYLTDTPPTRAPIVIKLESKAIDIPAGESNYVVEDQYTLPVDVDAVSVYAHAHALARTMEGRAVLPDGRETPLLLIRDWDIRWQDQYRYRTPVALPRGTTVRMRFTYDNSAANGRNPSRPPVRVRWGANSTDEMAALWLEVVPRQPQDAGRCASGSIRVTSRRASRSR